ncbi:MAG: hypothetical protein ACREJO_09670 [Phycisphaerales bacterium]
MPTPILAQNTIFSQLQNATPEPLPESGGFAHYLFEDPWLPAIGIAILGIAVLYALRSRGKPRAGVLVALAGVLIAAGIVVLASAVETDRERLILETRRLVEAGFRADAQTADALLAGDVSLTILTRDSKRTKDYLVQQIRSDIAKRYGVDGYDIRGVRAAIDGPRTGRSQISVTAKGAYPTPTVWMLTWRQDATSGQWRVWKIEAQQIGAMRPGSLSDL